MYHATQDLIPALKNLDPNAVFNDSIEVFISGVADLAKLKPRLVPIPECAAKCA
jgi:hypothetical protein